MNATPSKDSAGIESACTRSRWLAGTALNLTSTSDPNEAADFVSARRRAGDGVVMGSVALVQQEDGGDEWLALKRDGSAWEAFDSLSLSWASDERARFAALVGSMRGATPEQCRRLQYRPLSERSEAVHAATARERSREVLPGAVR